MTIKMIVTWSFTVIGSFIVKFLGGADILLKVTCLMIVLDYFSGIIKGYLNQELDSKKGTKGIAKKTLYVVAIMMCVALDSITHLNEAGLSFRSIILLYITGTEGISIMENLEAAGIKMPDKIRTVLRKMKDEEPK